MNQETKPDEIAKKMVIYQIPGVDVVTIRKDVEYKVTDADALTMDIYYPSDWKSRERIPAVIIVGGYPDSGCQKVFGCKSKEIGSSISWGKLVAASGMMAITYTNREPAADIHT